jgi:hypothetical protein
MRAVIVENYSSIDQVELKQVPSLISPEAYRNSPSTCGKTVTDRTGLPI